MSAEQNLLTSLEALSRSAMLRAIADDDTSLGLSACTEMHLLAGMASGDLVPISESEFERELFTAIEQPLSGWGKKFRKSFKKLRKKISPKKIIKRVVKVTKKVASKTFKAVKKVAPYAAAGAAIYYGAPYLMKGGSFLYNKAAGMMGGAVSPAVASGKTIAGGALTAAATQRATQIATRLLIKNDGVNMQSPESQAALQQYMAQQTAQMMPPPPGVVQPQGGRYKPEQKTDLMKYALPAAGLVAAAALI
jgi:hypothetical protein